jgi:hypothetical protein
MDALQPEDPQQVGRYLLLRRLGSGGMGRVYAAKSPGGRLVAVKLIRPELAGDPAFRARFAREVAAARLVSGIFTAPVVDADPDAPQPWLVTGYVDGPSLATAVTGYGPLPVDAVLTLAAGLAEGLAAIHAAGVLHRDLKPSNVLLASDGPRIIDFGISRAVDATGLTYAGAVLGSPGYMSPEQAEGLSIGPASDVFSLGGVLAYAATGEEPFGIGPPSTLLYRVVHSAPAITSLSERVRPLIERCLAKEPRQRPTTDEILAEAGGASPASGWLPWAAPPSTPTAPPEPPAATVIDTPPATPGESASAAKPAGAGSAAGPAKLARPAKIASTALIARAADAARIAKAVGAAGAARALRAFSAARLGGARKRPPRWAWITCLLAAALAAGVLTAVLTSGPPGPAQPGRAGAAGHAAQRPREVVEAYFAAINRRDWPQVWRLGGKKLSPSYRSMVAGFRHTRRDVVASLKTRGDLVFVRVRAYEFGGAVQTYALSYRVRRGLITSGRQTLLSTRNP